ncbi:uncharacterized protein [Notamacropus eugenii]
MWYGRDLRHSLLLYVISDFINKDTHAQFQSQVEVKTSDHEASWHTPAALPGSVLLLGYCTSWKCRKRGKKKFLSR